VPGSANGFAIFAESAPVVRRGSLLPAPDREGISLKLVDVIKSIAPVVVEATLYLLAWLLSEGPFMSDDLDALDLLPVLLEIHVLDKEEAALHPLVGSPSLRAS
jgi:hypothetical protein